MPTCFPHQERLRREAEEEMQRRRKAEETTRPKCTFLKRGQGKRAGDQVKLAEIMRKEDRKNKSKLRPRKSFQLGQHMIQKFGEDAKDLHTRVWDATESSGADASRPATSRNRTRQVVGPIRPRTAGRGVSSSPFLVGGASDEQSILTSQKKGARNAEQMLKLSTSKNNDPPAKCTCLR